MGKERTVNGLFEVLAAPGHLFSPHPKCMGCDVCAPAVEVLVIYEQSDDVASKLVAALAYMRTHASRCVIRYNLVRALGKTGSAARIAVPELEQAAKHTREEVRVVARRVLRSIQKYVDQP